MNKVEVVNKMTRMFHMTNLQIKKHSPEILIAAGVVGTVASAVMACKATLKVNEVLEPAKHDVEKIHAAKENGVTEAGKEYTEEDSKKDLAIVYVQTGIKLVKLYAPAVILGTLSITGILASHNILRKRNVALAAAYTAVDKGFKEYRGRVVERFGEELDKELRYNIKAKEVEEKVVDENGEEKIEKRIVQVAEPNLGSTYARFFDETCMNWTRDAETNLMTLKTVQNYATNKLRSQGFLFLNEVYDMLGIQRSKAGQVVGWIYDENDKNGDNYVDFGIFDVHDECKRRFVNGYEHSILLDFNVDGPILEAIEKRGLFGRLFVD